MSTFANLTPAELKARLDAGESLQLIDVREPHEWEVARVEGAALKPLSRFREWCAELGAAEGPHVLFCHHGMRSQQACAALAKMGVEGLHNLSGGIDAWSRQIDPAVPTY